MKQYSTPKHLTEKHNWLSPGGLRFYLFNRETNGLKDSGAIVRLGRKILIDEEKFFQWIENLNKDASQNGK